MLRIFLIVRNLTPVQFLATGYFVISIIGGIILSLPIATADGDFSPFLDSLFTSTSAVTTTGLIVYDTGSYYNLFGQSVIMILFQIGGLGYMLFAVLAYSVLKTRFSLYGGMVLRESLKRPRKLDIFYFTKLVFIYTFAIELMGVIFLTILFSFRFPFSHALYSAVFHSISAFNTAGFSIYSDSLSQFNSNPFFHCIMIPLFTMGSLGFFVLYDATQFVYRKAKGIHPNFFSAHTKLVFVVMACLCFTAAVFIYFSEDWGPGVSAKEQFFSSAFQSTTAVSTTGFNSIDIGRMSGPSLFLIIFMMFIGAGSGGTAGGVKLTTLGVILAFIYAIVSNSKDVNIFKRRLPEGLINDALAIVVLAGLWLGFATFCLLISEQQDLLPTLFETTSALGTVGLSTGMTSQLTPFGRLIIIITMFIGRVGPLGIGLSLFLKKRASAFRYANGEIYVG